MVCINLKEINKKIKILKFKIKAYKKKAVIILDFKGV